MGCVLHDIAENVFLAVGAEGNSAAYAYYECQLDFGKLTRQLAVTASALPEHNFVATDI